MLRQCFWHVLLILWIHSITVDFVLSEPFVVTGPNGTTGGLGFVAVESIYQSEVTTDFNFVFIPGSDMDDQSTQVIPDRYKCEGLEVKFKVDKDDPLLIEGEFKGDDEGSCDVYWGDDTDDEIKFNKDPKVKEEHTFPKPGFYKPVVVCGPKSCPDFSGSCVSSQFMFDAIFKSLETPLKILVTVPFAVTAKIQIEPECSSYPPTFTWRMIHVEDESTFTAYTDFSQPNLSALKLPPETINPGLYIIELQVTFPDKSDTDFVSDFLFVRLILPELIASIDGGDEITFPKDEIYHLNASRSRDPVTRLPDITSLPLVTKWSAVCFASLQELTKTQYIAQYPTKSLPPNAVDFAVDNGTEFTLVFDTSLASSYTWCFVMIVLKRGDRETSTVQAINLVENTIGVSLVCVTNCNRGREKKIANEQIQFDSVVDTSVDVTYSWKVFKWIGLFNIFLDITLLVPTQTGRTTRSFGIDKGTLGVEDMYRFRLIVSSDGKTNGHADHIRTVNTLPYGGTCTLDKLTGVASQDLFTIDCQGWQGADERKKRDAINLVNLIDINPMVSFTIIQHVAGAALEEEPIAFARSRGFIILLKPGDPTNSFTTSLFVRIGDIYGDFFETVLTVQSLPAFDYAAVDATEAGAEIVNAFMTGPYLSTMTNLVNIGQSDLVVIQATSVASHFYYIILPVLEPPLPRSVENPTGQILDLFPGGGNTGDSLGEVQKEVANMTVDPATVRLQEAIEDISKTVAAILYAHVVNGTRKEDKRFISTLTNSLTNMIPRPNFVNSVVKTLLIKIGSELSVISLFPPEGTEPGDDDGPQVEVNSAEIVDMYSTTVNAVVPDTLAEVNFGLESLTSGRYQIQEQLSFSSDKYSLEDAEMSPEERALFYIRIQLQLALDLEEARLQAKGTAQAALKMAKDVQDAAKLCKTCTNENREKAKQLLVKHDAQVVAKRNIPTKNATVNLAGLTEKGNESVSASIVNFDENVFMYDTNKKSSQISSGIIHIDIKSTESDTIVSMGYIKYSQDVPTPEAVMVVPILDDEDASYFSLHRFKYRSTGDQVCIIIKPVEPGVREYQVYVRLSEAPDILDYEFIVTVDIDSNWHTCILPEKIGDFTGVAYLGVQMDKTKAAEDQQYEFTLITVACMVWDEDLTEWLSDKCELEWFPHLNSINCDCKDVRDLTLANSFYVAPNAIDFSSVFLKFSPLNQAAVMGALASIFVIYGLAVLWARRKDRLDVLQWGITPLRDNFFDDTYFYLINVSTGLRHAAGTTAHIGFILTGDDTDTGERELFDGIRREFSRGSVMSFLMASNRHLGELMHICLWHDNKGEDGTSSAWYVSRIVVQDIFKDDVYTFVCEQWLSIETSLEIQVLPNPRQNAVPFSHRFFIQAKERLSDGHMWISIVYRPVTSNFTRAQRVSCALVYVMLTMIANAIYFNPAADFEVPALIQLGPLRFTLQQMYISLLCALISTPAVLLIATLFKRSKRQPVPDMSPYKYRDRDGVPTNTDGSKMSWLQRQRYHSLELEKTLLSKGVPEYQGCYLHYNFEFIGWGLVFIGTILPAFFVMLYSMQWGKQKSENWLSSFFLAMFESFLFIDPIMVLSIAFILAIILKSNEVERFRLDKIQLLLTFRKRFRCLPFSRNPPPRPLDTADLADATRRHKNQEFLKSAVKNIFINMFFMLVIFSICYMNRDDRSYNYHHEVVSNMLTPKKLPNFYKIKTPGEVYTWLNQTVFPYLFPIEDINGGKLHWTMREFTSSFSSYRLGPPRLRQLRTKPKMCTIPLYGTVPCYGQYEWFDEDESEHCIGWDTSPSCPPEEKVYNYSTEAWVFTSALDIWGLPMSGDYTTYGGGGYIAQFAINREASIDILNELYNNIWLDRQTRAVILEFTLYCGNANMFLYNMFMIEFPQTGGAFLTSNVFPLRLYLHEGSVGVYTLIMEVIFVIYIGYLFVKICFGFYKHRCRFFRNVWCVYDLTQFGLGASAVGVYFMRLGFTSLTIEKFMEDQKLFVNFFHIVFWDQLLIILLAFLVFLATLRILQIFGTSKKVAALVKVFDDCGSDLFWYGMNFMWMFLGFAILGTLLFGYLLYNYKNIYRTLTTLFTACIGNKIYAEVEQTAPILAKVFFMLFIVTVVFFTLSLFLSILSGSIDNAVQGTRKDEREDIMDFMMTWFKGLVVRQRMQQASNVRQVNVSAAPKPRTRERTKPPKKPIKIGI